MTKRHKYFYMFPLSRAVTALENCLPESIAEIRESERARSVAEREIEDIEHVLNRFKLELGRLKSKAPQLAGGGA